MADNDQKPRNFLQTLVDALIDQTGWATSMLADETARKAIAADLGLNEQKLGKPPEEAASIKAYRDAATSGERIGKLALLGVIDDIFALYETLISIGEAAYEAEEGERVEEGAREAAHHLVNLLLVNWLRLRVPVLFKLGQVLGFVEEISSTNLSEKVYFDRIPAFLTDPGGHLKSTFGSLETEQDAKELSDHIFPLLATFMAIQGRKEETHSKKLLPDFFATKNVIYGWDAAPGSTTEAADQISARTFSIAFEYRKQEAGGNASEGELDLTLLFVPRSDGGPGVFLSLSGEGGVEGRLSDDWRLKVEARAAGAFDLLIGPDTKAGGSVDTSASVRVGPEPDAPGQKNVFPDSRGMRLEFGRLSFSGEINASGAGFEVVAEDGAFVISTDECDSFIAETLPGEEKKPADDKGPPAKETRISFNLGLGYSSERDFYITGGAGLQLVIPLGKTVGPVTIQQLLLRLTPTTDPKPARLTIETTVGMSARLGPLTAVVDQIGLRALVPFEKNEDDDKYHYSIGFKPPTGVGLQIESAAVTGGGFLFYDSERGQYGGVLSLVLTRSNISLKAVGLISTRLPGGAKGFSMIVLVTAEGFKPIPLGLGFTLTGVGGLVAINRTFNEEAVGEGIKSHMLERVLFPKDPIKNAPQIISSLDTFFPARKGSYLFGFLAQISWGPGSPVKMELALILETGKRLRLIILGRVSAVLPREEHDLVRLNMDAVGIIDFDQGTASIDAALYDSRLLKKFVLTGSMAMRLRWSGSPLFALSVGGFHPAFKPPAGFPALERIALSLSESEDFRLRCEGYFALTSNSLQFGAHAELLARAAGFSFHGQIGYDVLIQFDPFFFRADFHASVQLKRGSTNLFKVKLEGSLSGPRPLNVKGKATFEIFWCDFSVGFNKTLISGQPPPPAERVVVTERLTAALSDARNWGGQLADGERRLVTLRERSVEGEIALHPLGTLSVKQTVVPLNLEIAKFGQTTPADARFFKINSVSVGGQSLPFAPVRDFFAPAEFLEMTDDEKLSAPSFESLTAGMSLSADGFVLPANDDDLIEDPAIRYETFIVEGKSGPPRKQGEPSALGADHLGKQISFGAAAMSDVRRTGAEKYRPAVVRNTLAKTGWVIVADADQSRRAAPGIEAGELVAYAEAFQALQKLKRENPARARGLKIIRASEETVNASEVT